MIEACPYIEPLSHRVLKDICYPRGPCSNLIEEIRLAGIDGLCRSERYPGHHVILGKGHSSIVALGLWNNQIVAIKIRRIDSKRKSLVREANLMLEASRGGAAPKPYYFTKNIIIMEYIPGPHFIEAIQSSSWKKAIIQALEAARILDSMNILHYELRRPWRHIRFTEGGKALILDYESAGRGCGSLLKLIGGLIPLMGGVRILERLRKLLLEYNKYCDKKSYDSIISTVLDILNVATPPFLRDPGHLQAR